MNILHNIIEPAFDDTATSNYLLSLCAGGDSFSYLITNSEQQILGLRSYVKSGADKTNLQFLKKVIPQDSLLRHKYGKVRICWHSPKFTLVPDALWEEQQAETLLKATVRVHSGETCRHHAIQAGVKVQSVFAIENSPLQLLQQQYPHATLRHSLSGLLLYLLNHLPASDELQAAAHLYADTWTITILHKGKLLYHNSFKYKNSSDCLYYTLSVFKYLNLNPQKNLLYLSGELFEESEIYQLLYKYIQQLKFVERPSFYQYSEAFQQQVPAHFYLELLSLQLCE